MISRRNSRVLAVEGLSHLRARLVGCRLRR